MVCPNSHFVFSQKFIHR